VLERLAKAGSDLSKPHRLEHHFLCADRAAAAPVIRWARAAGYEPGPVADGVQYGQAYVYFDLVSQVVPTPETIAAQSTAMLEAAARFGVEYDGWGCFVVP